MGSDTFRVGLSRDIRATNGSTIFGDLGLGALEAAPGVDWDFLAEDADELRPDLLQDFDALFLSRSRISEASLVGIERLTLVTRLGVGYDRVDVGACTKSGVLLTITPDAVRRPVAVSALAFILALAHKLFVKDRLIRAGRWHEGRTHLGLGLTKRTLGLIGAGNIGREILSLAKPFGLRLVVHDPFVSDRELRALGAEPAALEGLLSTADFVVVACPLNEETRALLDADRLALMKPDAYLINVARGPIVDQRALIEILAGGRIAGAALDVFESEPIEPGNPLLELENVILTPHAVAVTEEWALFGGRTACGAALEVAAGRIPSNVVNDAVRENPRLQKKLSRYAKRPEGR